MNVLILGHTGMLGHMVVKYLKNKGVQSFRENEVNGDLLIDVRVKNDNLFKISSGNFL